MPHYGLLGKHELIEAVDDVRGATLYGRDDEKLGKIDDVIFNHATGDIGYIVVDTGGWLTTKKFIVPANRLQLSSKDDDDFVVDLTKQQIESFPPFRENDLESEDKWTDYEGKYRSKWETGPVMHRKETDRNITPTSHQMLGNESSLRASSGLPRPTPAETGDDRESVEAASASTGRIVRAGEDTVIIENTAVGIGARWDTFQARLRERRKEAVAGCRTCSVGPASVKGSESADMLKKAI